MSSAAQSDQPDARRRLLEEAARILDEQGPAALSARRLAAGAGTSTMGVYTHFGSMGALVDAVATEGFRRLIERVDAVEPTDDPAADLLAAAGAYRANALENPHLYAVMFGSISVRALGGAGPDDAVAYAAFRQLVALVERAMDAGQLRRDDPGAVAAQWWSALHGYMVLELAGMDQVVKDPEHHVLWQLMGNLLRALSD
ncbi:TetR/AcrR family transcriptional regulator [Aeromicrobium duanguangcaii]|uniref:TetR/AcrR family transcriptional regulator n=1 Tax=Aeromicrobium duanguangcaii TaxID=2968086 RepID=A0ABY5KFL2_9ACTN|nr:TetR/AcrR family transcriptional regulator [Aeromicrobium duanguangcaii]MCD9153661.1 TetR/AcrR family transcriptional regulator [Aeromicrobium duanguangcaii]UUI69256.1 TetR/AcrR family transcriptional regulator [Aeromicrobium duanguangcaii]